MIRNTLKQTKYTVNGQKIYSKNILKNINKDSLLLITAAQFENAIIYELKSLDYKGQVFTIRP